VSEVTFHTPLLDIARSNWLTVVVLRASHAFDMIELNRKWNTDNLRYAICQIVNSTREQSNGD
jgi:hypothetical protein